MKNRIELKRALDALQDIAGDASDLIPALEAAEKVFDWVLMESYQVAGISDPRLYENHPDKKKIASIAEAMREAFAEAYDREAEWTGRA